MNLTKQQEQQAYPALKDVVGIKNVMQAPRLTKVVISVGVGKVSRDKNRVALIEDRLALITGQKPVARGAKQSIASFKVRAGDKVGYQVTLRGERMYDFLDKLIHIALPRTRDFQGVSPNAIDAMGNITIGIKEHTIFPETTDENLSDVFSLAVTVVTTAKDRQTAEAFLRHIGLPLR